MVEPFQFAHRLAFAAEQGEAILREVPTRAGVFALRGERATDQPYLLRAADLRRRLRRLLTPPESLDAEGRPALSKRLNLRDRVRWVEWTETGSEFESVLLLYRALGANFGEDNARQRMRLFPPYFLRISIGHEHPRVMVTGRLSERSLGESFGPFATRGAAERMAEAVGELFKLRRCHEDLLVHPDHPGCAYGEMNRCLAPCKMACSAEAYHREAQEVFAYLRSRGASLMDTIATQREAASEAMDFEGAAALHRQWEKAQTVFQSADPLVRAAGEVRALVVQVATWAAGEDGAAGAGAAEAGAAEAGAAEAGVAGAGAVGAAVFLLDRGRIVGPERLSTLGVRAVREQTAVGSSLFAQPLMLSAVPEAGSPGLPPSPANGAFGAKPASTQSATAGSPEDRARRVIELLEDRVQAVGEPDPAERGDALALFKRWYYRPEKSRAGEVLLPNEDGSWPVRRLLNAAARVVLGPPALAPAVDREAASLAAVQEEARTRVLHPGREGVERTVAMLPKRKRGGKAIPPGEVVP